MSPVSGGSPEWATRLCAGPSLVARPPRGSGLSGAAGAHRWRGPTPLPRVLSQAARTSRAWARTPCSRTAAPRPAVDAGADAVVLGVGVVVGVGSRSGLAWVGGGDMRAGPAYREARAII